MAELRRDPARPVHARVDELEVELRVVTPEPSGAGIGSRLAAIGPWEGVSMEELMEILRSGRAAGGSADPPELP